MSRCEATKSASSMVTRKASLLACALPSGHDGHHVDGDLSWNHQATTCISCLDGKLRDGHCRGGAGDCAYPPAMTARDWLLVVAIVSMLGCAFCAAVVAWGML